MANFSPSINQAAKNFLLKLVNICFVQTFNNLLKKK